VFCDLFVSKSGSAGLKEFKGSVHSEDFLSILIDDGSPLRNEFLVKVSERAERLEVKKKDLFSVYKEDNFKELVSDLKESTDDLFDSKGDDISDKEFLENEMSQEY
jgi:hypothetical protein